MLHSILFQQPANRQNIDLCFAWDLSLNVLGDGYDRQNDDIGGSEMVLGAMPFEGLTEAEIEPCLN